MAAVFDFGKVEVKEVRKDHNIFSASSPPKSLLIVTPSETGRYPVVLFLHGFWLRNSDYLQVLRHIASHGFILVAPQLFAVLPTTSPEEDIAAAAAVCDWLIEGLKSLLPEGVTADLDRVGLSGHSRGGHAAFALALGHAKTSLQFSALVGVDPVAGSGRSNQVSPKILTYEPSSFAIDFPILVVGTGLGNHKKNPFPPCAPEGVNHEEFYRESRPTCYHLVAKDYGHLDMLDYGAAKVQKSVGKSANDRCKDAMRRTTAGVMTAFLKAYLCDEGAELAAIVENRELAPTTLDPVQFLPKPALAGVIKSKL